MSALYDSEVEEFTGQIKIHLGQAHEWPEKTRLHHRKVLKHNYSKLLLTVPCEHVTNSVWDEMINTLNKAGILPETDLIRSDVVDPNKRVEAASRAFQSDIGDLTIH